MSGRNMVASTLVYKLGVVKRTQRPHILFGVTSLTIRGLQTPPLVPPCRTESSSLFQWSTDYQFGSVEPLNISSIHRDMRMRC